MQYEYLIEHENMVPKDFDKAIASEEGEHWQGAVDDEIKSLNKQETWIFVDKPKRWVKYITGAFIFKKKFVGLTKLTKYKARLIAHGYRQRYGEDYYETYAPVCSSRAIRILLALAASNGMMIHQMDVETAFLHAPLEEEIYMIPPKGLIVPEGKVLLLKKSLYGLKQSPRNFNMELNKTIVDLLGAYRTHVSISKISMVKMSM